MLFSFSSIYSYLRIGFINSIITTEGVTSCRQIGLAFLTVIFFPQVESADHLLLQGLSLVLSSYNGEDILVSFGGYNGHYSNEVSSNLPFLWIPLPSFFPSF
jgi:hypothetical protein